MKFKFDRNRYSILTIVILSAAIVDFLQTVELKINVILTDN